MKALLALAALLLAVTPTLLTGCDQPAQAQTTPAAAPAAPDPDPTAAPAAAAATLPWAGKARPVVLAGVILTCDCTLEQLTHLKRAVAGRLRREFGEFASSGTNLNVWVNLPQTEKDLLVGSFSSENGLYSDEIELDALPDSFGKLVDKIAESVETSISEEEEARPKSGLHRTLRTGGIGVGHHSTPAAKAHKAHKAAKRPPAAPAKK